MAEELRELSVSNDKLGLSVQRLAHRRWSSIGLDRLGRRIARSIVDGDDLRPLQELRISIIGTGTLDLIAPVLVASAARYGLAMCCDIGRYGQALHEALSPNALLHAGNPDFVLISLDHRSFSIDPCAGDASAAASRVESAANLVLAMVSSIGRLSKATCILQTIAPPAESLFGSLDRLVPGTALFHDPGPK